MNRKLWKAVAKIYYRRSLALRSELERKTTQIEAMGEEIERWKRLREQVADERDAAWDEVKLSRAERDKLANTVSRLRRLVGRSMERLEGKGD